MRALRIQPEPLFASMGRAVGVQGRVTVVSETGEERRCLLLSCFHLVPLEDGNGRGKHLRAKGRLGR